MSDLNDALTVATTDAAFLPNGASGDDAVMAKLVAKMSGEPAETQETEEVEETSEETSEETTEEEETEVDEDSEEDEEEVEEEESDEAGSDEEIELTEDQLAESLGVKAGNVRLDDDGNVLIKTKIDGKVEFASLDELRNSFVRESNFTQKAQSLATDRKTFEDTTQQHVQHMTKQVGDATALVQALEQQLMGDVQGLDLNQMKINDPGRWAAVNQEIGQRQQFIQNTKAQLHQNIQQGQQQSQQKAADSRQQLILDEADKLLTAFPKWQDEDVASVEIEETKKLMADKYGIPEDVINSMPYAGFILMARDAMKVSALDDDVKTVKKKLKSIPKIVKSGKRSKTTGTRDDKEKANRKNALKQSGSIKDAAAAIFDRI